METSSRFTATFDVIKGEAKRRGLVDPTFTCPPHPDDNRPGGYYGTTGIPVRKDGRAEAEDLNVCCRNALVNMIDYIVDRHGLSPEQAYCLSSVAVNLRISNVVDVPNFVVSAFLPLDVFA